MKYQFNTSDNHYRNAFNYDGTNYYNSPMTIDIEGKLFIIPCGTSDRKTVKITGNELYIVSENANLNYIGMTVINIVTNEVESCFLQGQDLDNDENISYGLLDKDTEDQIKILAEYLPY